MSNDWLERSLSALEAQAQGWPTWEAGGGECGAAVRDSCCRATQRPNELS